jgi:CubicO group peptidase (beta-lactamase class C family)
VIVDGELAGAAVSGERRRDSGISVTVDDRWHVGSITKSMTATLLAVLEDDGLLSADDTLPALLPDVEMAGGWSACTLHHLVTHTAGAPRDFPSESQAVWPDTAEELVAERRRFIADVLAAEPESPCGESFAYSNVGYTIAGHIAETIAGRPYEALLQDRVFAPLMLASAGFGPPQGDAPNQEPIGHVVLLRWFRLRADPFKTRADNSPVTSPAGAVHMTIGDLARFGAAHLEGESATAPPLLPRAAWERLHTPFLDDYASGWVRVERDWAGGSVLWHNGSNTMWYALLMLLPASNTVLALATNDGAIQAAETAFVELARELGGRAPAS